jgi:hypothetical protein
MNTISDTITAKNINIVNDKGEVVIKLAGNQSDGSSCLELIGKNERLLLQCKPDGKISISIDKPPLIGVLNITTDALLFINTAKNE